jgi:hypothetical protein
MGRTQTSFFAHRIPRFHKRSAELQIPPRRAGTGRLRSPGFPVEPVALTDLMRLSLRERRTRDLVQCSVAGNPGRDDKGKGDILMESGSLKEGLFHHLR